MLNLHEKAKQGLDETRTLVLGTQVLVGFEFEAVFEPRFADLSHGGKYMVLAALILLLVAMALLMAPVPFHRIAAGGHDTFDFQQFVSAALSAALLPFTAALGLDLFTAVFLVVGRTAAVGVACVTVAIALYFWYAAGYLSRKHSGIVWMKIDTTIHSAEKTPAPDEGSLTRKINEVLTECRVVLPGAQAFLGFQFIIVLTREFQALPASLRDVHLFSLLCITLSLILLMTPAAYHRIGDLGEDREDCYIFGCRTLLASMVPLAVGICADLYVAAARITGQPLTAGILSGAILLFCLGLWFGYSLWRRCPKQPAIILPGRAAG